MDEEFLLTKTCAFIIGSRKELGRSSPFALQLALKRVSSSSGERKHTLPTKMRSKLSKGGLYSRVIDSEKKDA
jgi:hypothetical protein